MTDASFSAALLDPAHPVPEGLITPDGSPATRRYAIYRNNVTVGLTEALEAGFPVIRKIVGERFFQAMAVVFVRNHPPTSPILAGYGAEMPGFLRGFEPVQHLKYLPDVARLELALRRAYHAGDAAPVLIVTHKCTRSQLDQALEAIAALDVVTQTPVALRIEQV